MTDVITLTNGVRMIRNTGIPVAQVLTELADKQSFVGVLAAHPGLLVEDIAAAIRYGVTCIEPLRVTQTANGSEAAARVEPIPVKPVAEEPAPAPKLKKGKRG